MLHALLLILGFFFLAFVLMAVAVTAEPSQTGPFLCRLGFHRWGKPYEPMDNGYMECCTRPHCDALHEIVTDDGV